MQFYRVEGIIVDDKYYENDKFKHLSDEEIEDFARLSDSFYRKFDSKFYFFIENIVRGKISVGIYCFHSKGLEQALSGFLKELDLTLKIFSIKEITFSEICVMLYTAGRHDYIENYNSILHRLDLDELDDNHNLFGETVLDEVEKVSIYKRAEQNLARDELVSELDRIYKGKKQKRICGHPVHYIIQTDDPDTRKEGYRIILQALYANHRLNSKRYCFLDIGSGEQVINEKMFDAIYKSCIGGAVIVRYISDDASDENVVTGTQDDIEKACRTMMKYSNQVLTVFCFPRACSKIRDTFFANLSNTSFIEIKEEFVFGDSAKRFLEKTAKDYNVKPDNELYSGIEENKGYLAPDLHQIFDEWLNKKLKTKVYPQYKEIGAVKKSLIKSEPKGSAYEELFGMIGIENAKRVISQALDYYKAQRIFADKGMKTDVPTMHMVFTGNPGTAKTTVARLFSKIMRDNHLLSKGHIVEVGRADLVGKYVGWTAPTIKKKFKEAMGGVLFIDEAYSLVDDWDGSYGDEAINTIVQEMENHREDVIVIFAGYPDKMEGFLQKNPGLRSRIAFHIPFSDYTPDELCSIAKLIAEKKGLKLAEDTDIKLKELFEKSISENDFGNGRYVRNVIEKAKMALSTRLLKMDYETVKDDDVITIRAEDIEIPPEPPKSEHKPIGFRAA